MVWGLVKRNFDANIGKNFDYSDAAVRKCFQDSLATITPEIWQNCFKLIVARIKEDYQREVIDAKIDIDDFKNRYMREDTNEELSDDNFNDLITADIDATEDDEIGYLLSIDDYPWLGAEVEVSTTEELASDNVKADITDDDADDGIYWDDKSACWMSIGNCSWLGGEVEVSTAEALSEMPHVHPVFFFFFLCPSLLL